MASVFFGEIKEYFLSMSNKRERKEIEAFFPEMAYGI